MLKSEGYKMFVGVMKITPKDAVWSRHIHGTWLYKPDTDCWYCNGSSFPAECCEIEEDKGER